jgi:glycosyltransferase involved in cell wall biosynthesis
LKILFLAPQPFYVERGTPIAVRTAVDALCDEGHEVDLVVFHEGADWQRQGMRLIRIPAPPGIRNVRIGLSPKKLICDLWLAATAARLIARGRYDVVHAVEEAVFIGLACRLIRRFRLVYDMDSLMVDQIEEKWPAARRISAPMRAMEALAVRRADLVLPVCAAIEDRAVAIAGRQTVRLLPDVGLGTEPDPSVSVDDLREGWREERPIALYVGNLEAYQGIDLLLQAMRVMPPQGRCHLVIIGGDEESVRAYRQAAERDGLGVDVRFLGPRPLSALPGFLAQADILCSPRLKGVNTPMKVYSYMASGRSIVATAIRSHTQVLDEGSAELVEPTPDAFAAGLARLSASPALRAALAERARAHVLEHYSLAAFRLRLREAYALVDDDGVAKASSGAPAHP